MIEESLMKDIDFSKKNLKLFLEANNAPENVENSLICLNKGLSLVLSQNNAMDMLIKNLECRLEYYYVLETKNYESVNTLKSERQANEILTNEVERLEDEITALKKQVKELQGK